MQVSNKHHSIAGEGWAYIAVAIILAVLLLIAEKYIFSSILAFFTALLLFIYRDPERIVPSVPLGIVSPIDGRILAIEEKQCDVAQAKMWCVSIKLNAWGVFSVRSPIEGKIVKQINNASKSDPLYLNWVATDEGDNILWSLAPLSFGRPRCYVQTGERIGQGQRCGFSPFNAIVSLYIPQNSVISVKINSRVTAGQTIIAKLVHQSGASIVSA